MSRILRFSVAVTVVLLWGCSKKAETPPPASAPATEAATAAPAQTPSEAAAAPTASTAAPNSKPGELAIIAKARAFLGSDEALDRITTIHFVGALTTSDPADPKKQTRAAVEIVVQKPDKQRVTIKYDKAIEATGLDGFEAWTRTTSVDDPTKWKQTLLGVDGVKRLRANTWENIAFYRGIEKDGGSVQDLGPAKMDGVDCEKVEFVHGPNIVFTRYFDRATGHLVYSETDTAATIRESGDITVDGVHFPKTVVTVSKNQSGQDQAVTITFDRIVLNETFPADYFAVPSLSNR